MQVISDPKEVTARKKHYCEWCGGVIEKGEKYNTATYKNDELFVWKAHVKCDFLTHKLNMFEDDYGDGIDSQVFHSYIVDEFVAKTKEAKKPIKEMVEFLYEQLK